MSRVRINRKVVKLKEERKHYLSGNTLYAEGRAQGKVEAKRDFGENIYEQNQFDSHLELTIPLPTELIKLDDVDYDSIAKDLVKSLNLEDKYGIDNVAYYVHHRDETSGRTKNDNLHVHICYVDRVIEKNNELKLYQSNKKPHGINLINGSNIKAGVFKDDSIHHFKIESSTPKLDFSLVEESTLEKFKNATSNGRKKKFNDEELNTVNELKQQIINQAQSKSVGAIIYSNRHESKDIDKTKLKSITKEQRQAVANVLNKIIDNYDLKETLKKHGRFNSNTKRQEIEELEKNFYEEVEVFDLEKLELYKSKLILLNDEMKFIKNVTNKEIALDDEYLRALTNSNLDVELNIDARTLEEVHKYILEDLNNGNYNDSTDYFKECFEIAQNLVAAARENMKIIEIDIANQIDMQKKELTVVTEAVKNKNMELTKVTTDYNVINDGLTKIITDYDSKNEELTKVTNSITNKNGELDQLVAKALPDAVKKEVNTIIKNNIDKYTTQEIEVLKVHSEVVNTGELEYIAYLVDEFNEKVIVSGNELIITDNHYASIEDYDEYLIEELEKINDVIETYKRNESVKVNRNGGRSNNYGGLSQSKGRSLADILANDKKNNNVRTERDSPWYIETWENTR